MQEKKTGPEIYTLDNGFRIVAEVIPFFPSVSVGLWIGAGSAYETVETNGFSHFIEHMLFKSTDTRSTMDIASEIDCLGGHVNAFTSKECTCYYAKVITEHFERALRLLGDFLLHPRFDSEELEKERGVILEEIAMSEDTPDELVFDLLSEAWFGAHPLGFPILGYQDRIAMASRDDIFDFRQKNYRPDNTVLAVVGQFDTDRMLELCNEIFGSWKVDSPVVTLPAIGQVSPRAIIREKDIEQVHIAQAWPGVDQDDKRMYPVSVLCNLLGGGNASRLFQKIREEMGLAYTVYSYPSVYVNTGTVILYAATSPEHAQAVSHLLHEEIQKLKEGGITEEEFYMAKEQLKVSYILGMESSSSRMSALGRSLLLRGEIVDSDEVLANMEAVTLEETMEEIRQTFAGPYGAAAMGRNVADIYL